MGGARSGEARMFLFSAPCARAPGHAASRSASATSGTRKTTLRPKRARPPPRPAAHAAPHQHHLAPEHVAQPLGHGVAERGRGSLRDRRRDRRRDAAHRHVAAVGCAPNARVGRGGGRRCAPVAGTVGDGAVRPHLERARARRARLLRAAPRRRRRDGVYGGEDVVCVGTWRVMPRQVKSESGRVVLVATAPIAQHAL